VQRGDVKPAVVERGQVEPAHAADLVGRVRGRGPTKAASTIKWVIDDGAFVKKGDRLLELDDPAVLEELKGQEAVVAEKQALLATAEAALKAAEAGEGEPERAQAAVKVAEAELKKLRAAEERDRRKLEIKLQQARQAVEIIKLNKILPPEEAKLALQRAEGDVEIAEIDLKGHAEVVVAERQKLEAYLQQAQADLATAKVRAAGARDQAGAHVVAARAALDAENARLAELKEDVARTRLTAPMDGIVLYVTPEASRFGAAASTVAVGEPVRDGQKLLRVADLGKLQVKVRVHESQVSRLRPAKDGDDKARGQAALIRIDAFPDRTLPGHLRSLAAVADARDWAAADVKVYPGVVALDEAPAGLKPGMTAEVTFALDERKGVLRVPVQAVVAEGRERVCYVKAGDGVEKRKLTLGPSDQRYVEVKEGLKEGEEVLVNPQTERPAREGRGPGPKQARGRGAADVVVRSVRPPADAANARSFVLAYGLTPQDLEAIKSIESVTRAVPVRSFPQEARREDRVSRGRLVATVAEYAEVHPTELAKGRFLSSEDDRQLDNVAVLGPAAARELFPLDDPLGQTVRLGQYLYKVVGVVAERRAGDAPAAEDDERDVYIPLRTCQARFGDQVMIRSAGARTMEAVPLSQIILSVRSPDQVAPTVDLVTAQLRKSHDRKDWEVLAPGAP
jgi:RND family efflux transporter MFP subunit